MDAPQQDEPLDVGVAGRSARREHERRAARDAARADAERAAVRERLGDGMLGRAAAAIVVDDGPRRSTTAWSTGARGESIVGERLDGLRDRGIVALHDRRIPGSTANIDHIAITPTGVWVIDAKRYAGKRPSIVVDGSVLGFGGRRRLAIDGRRQDRLVDGMSKQVALVAAVVPEVAVRGMLCFVEADWPLIGGHCTIDGIRVVWPRRMVAELARPGAATVDVGAVARILAAAFPAA